MDHANASICNSFYKINDYDKVGCIRYDTPKKFAENILTVKKLLQLENCILKLVEQLKEMHENTEIDASINRNEFLQLEVCR